MKSYKPEELFNPDGALISELAELAPKGDRRMGANPHANGGILLRDLKMPDFRDHAVAVPRPGTAVAEATQVLGAFLRDVMKLNLEERNFRVVGPDETASNRLTYLFDITDRMSAAEILATDDHVSADGRVMEVLSEHLCQGWLEGYLLTGRHGFFSCYEAFIHIVDSMFNQHAKWLKVTRHIPWRRPIASLNYLLTSHVWRQDHNGFSHQDPGFIDHVVNTKADVIRVYLPPDANTLLSVADHCMRSRNYVNVIVAGKQPELQWLDMDSAIKHCAAGLGLWDWASNDQGGDPDAVMACAGDVPTLETLAAVDFLRQRFSDLKIRVINVVPARRPSRPRRANASLLRCCAVRSFGGRPPARPAMTATGGVRLRHACRYCHRAEVRKRLAQRRRRHRSARPAEVQIRRRRANTGRRPHGAKSSASARQWSLPQ